MATAESKIIDYISGLEINASPEEIEAVQVFSKQLVEDYGYSKKQIQTRPQFRVKSRPSDTKKEYPIDIAVFSDSKKNEDDVYIIVECKRRTRKDGKKQLEDYLRFCKATLGVWFNGDERLFLRKIEKGGLVIFEEVPNIPKSGQRIEDIGKFKKEDLQPSNNLKAVFRSIRNHLAANATGATRSEFLAQQLINLIFCKLYDEKYTSEDEFMKFRAGVVEKPKEIEKRIVSLFNEVKLNMPEVIDSTDKISLDANSVAYVVGELQNYSLMDSSRDVIVDAFETFIGNALKGEQGQFFTPRNVVQMLVDFISPSETDKIIDPACGSGGFLVDALKYVWNNAEKKYSKLKWKEKDIEKKKMAIATDNFRGLDKDYFLSKVAKAYMNLVGDGTTGIFNEDSLDIPLQWKPETQLKIQLGTFDVVLTNPPFGKELKVTGEDKLKQYDLSYDWKKTGGETTRTNNLKDEIQPQFLFIERCFQLLRDKGKLAIILPETFFHAPKMHHVMHFFKQHNIIALYDLPHNTFRPYNNAKCVALIIQKNVKQQDYINMAVAEQIGHDHNGKPMYRWDLKTEKLDKTKIWDDVPFIINEFNNPTSPKRYTFMVKESLVTKQNIFVPRYYWNSREKEIAETAKSKGCNLITINQLIKEGVLTTFDGHGSPESDNKGNGDVPYIRVKDIVNWEAYKDPTALIPMHVFKSMRRDDKALKEGDLLFVRRGSYRIGSVALVSPYDTEVLLTREILVIRIKDLKNQYNITPYYLIYLISHYLVQLQMYNKVLIETTLPNIANRWGELKLPIHQDIKTRKRISDKVQDIFNKKWDAQKSIIEMKVELGDITT
ncbi:MAG: N-6 DNA methylase [Chitinophagaceae bacterium]|nr:N-6 DNA methylase [Chitinophagaceae bacterium]